MQQKMMGKCCLSIFDFISKNVVVFQNAFFCQDLRNLITRQEFPMRNLLRQRKCSGEPIVWTLCIYTVISKCVKTLFFGTSPIALGLKKYLWFRFPTDPLFFCRPYYFFQIDHATLFSPGGCGLLIQRAKMASVVTLIIEPNCLNLSIGNTHL